MYVRAELNCIVENTSTLYSEYLIYIESVVQPNIPNHTLGIYFIKKKKKIKRHSFAPGTQETPDMMLAMFMTLVIV